ncbi:MAG: LmeA family phospholipid-binding protein [Actinomycetota bacterium]
MLRWIGILLLVLVVLLGVADFAARAFAERRVADAMQRELDLSEEPSVGIAEFPFMAAAAGGNFDSVTVEATDVARGDLTFARTTLTLKDVEFSLGQLLSGEHRRVSIGSGRGTARLSAEDVSAALEGQGIPGQVEFRNGAVFVTSQDVEGEVEGRLAIDDGRLTVLPVAASSSDGVELPEFGGDVTYEKVEVRGSTAVLTLTIDSRTIEL